MRAPIAVRAFMDDERQVVEASLRSSDASVLRRCQIGASLGCSDQWVGDVVHTFSADGLPSLERRAPC